MRTFQELENENIALRQQMQTLAETFRAIKMGEVDALVVSSPQGEKVFTLQDADYPYRVFVQEMHEGSVTLDESGTILYCNHHLALMLKKPLEKIIGSNFEEYIAPSEKQVFRGLFQQAKQVVIRGELNLITDDETQIPVYLSFKSLQLDNVAVTCLVVTDLTEQKRNAEIVASERLATSILEQAVEAIIVCDENGKITRANRAAQQFCGQNPLFQQFDVAFPLECNHCSILQIVEESCLFNNSQVINQKDFLLASLLEGQCYQGVEVLLRREDGGKLNLILGASPLLNSENKIIGSVITLTNITERKQVEEQIAQLVIREQAACAEAEAAEMALKESEEHLRLALEAAQMGTWDWNITTGYIKWSNRQQQLFGITPGTFESNYEAFLNCLHPEDRAAIHQKVMDAKDNKTEYYVEFRVIWSDGSIHWVAAKGKCIYDDEGRPVRMLGISLDVSDRKQVEEILHRSKAELEIKVAQRTAELSKANKHLHRLINVLTTTINQQTKIEAQLREAERRWRSLLENVQLLVVGLDGTGKVEYANPFFLALSGYTEEEVLDKDWFSEFIPQKEQRQIHNLFGEILEQGLHTHHQSQLLTKSQAEKVIAWNNTLLRDSQGQVIGTMSIGEDITQRQALDKIKDEFVSVVSHELRTPMTSIQGGLNLLAQGLVKLDSDKGKRIIQIASENAERLVRLVNDILDLERLQSGKVNLVKQKVEASELLSKAVDLMQLMFQKAEINLSVSTQSMELLVDQDRIIQVLTNLLSNAIKFSPPGSTVWMTVEKIPAKDTEAASALFKVQDQGRGIPADKIEAIFERFHQVDASDSRKQGGTGLGLAICRSIVEQHNGQMWVESTVGVGSSFYVKLPL